MRSSSLLALVLVVGCTDDGVERFEWQGEYVTVYGYGYSEADVCAGSLTALDERIGMVMDILGVEPPQQYRFTWASDDAWQERPFCAPPAFACSYRDKAWSRRLPDMHEAVHMVAASAAEDRCPPLLGEGLADYFDDPRLSRVVPADNYSLTTLIDGHPLPQSARTYARAMHFVSYLGCDPIGIAHGPMSTSMRVLVCLPTRLSLGLNQRGFLPSRAGRARRALYGSAHEPLRVWNPRLDLRCRVRR